MVFTSPTISIYNDSLREQYDRYNDAQNDLKRRYADVYTCLFKLTRGGRTTCKQAK